MTIGIIGTGALGGALAKKLAATGHEIKVTNKSPYDELQKKAAQLSATPVNIEDIAKDVDVIVLSIPTKAVGDLPVDLFKDMKPNAIIVDTTNYYPYRDGEMEEFSTGLLESMWVSQQIGKPVIKAFNNLSSFSIENAGMLQNQKGRIAMAISGDDERAKKTISSLINDIGFDVVDAGSLAESWRHQPGMPSYCTALDVEELKIALADEDNIKPEASRLRDLTTNKLMNSKKQLTHDDLLDIVRGLFPKKPKNKL